MSEEDKIKNKEEIPKEEEVPVEEETPAKEEEVPKVAEETLVEEETPAKEEEVPEVAEETPVEEEVPVEVAEETLVEEETSAKEEEASSQDEETNFDDENSLKLPFILGIKLGMTQIFSDNGTVYPATVIEAGPCSITQIKTIKKDGYSALQIGYVDVKKSKLNKPSLGHFNKSESPPKKHLKEFRYLESNDVSLGDEITLNQFNIGDMLKITGTSKGKGFAGHMKRHNFSGGRASHGKNSVMRKAGSIGAGTSPGRVWKGTRMAGRMGNDKVTIKNLEIIKMDSEKNLLFVSGSVPGANNNILCISKVN